jgi:predicted DsbA family dithiol-disulfide isomerase
LTPAREHLRRGECTIEGVMNHLKIDIWSDIACPWCYVGKRNLEDALRGFDHKDSVSVRWRAFELDPSAPRIKDPGQGYAERLAQKYSASIEQAQAMIQTMTDAAAARGLDFRFDIIRPGNTFDAHRLLHLAELRGLSEPTKERFLRGYMCEGLAIGDPEALLSMGLEAGLLEPELRSVLETDTYADEVRGDEEQARTLGITGVPFFMMSAEVRLSGAQPPETLLRSLDAAWKAAHPDAAADPDSAGDRCGPAGCD